jgi:hypothetical protein
LITRFEPDAVQLRNLGYSSIAHVPVLFGSDGSYLRVVNRYLRERATLQWPDTYEPDAAIAMGKVLRYPLSKSLKKFADNLVILLKWMESKNYDWSTVDYDPHLREFANDQAAGLSLQFQHPLKKRTIEQRLDHAIDFLLWSAARQLRPKPKIPMQRYHREFNSGRNSRPTAAAGQTRAGRVRADPIDLRLPTMNELRIWDEAVRLKNLL